MLMTLKNLFLEEIKNIPVDIQKQTFFSFAVSDKICKLLTEKGMTQKDLAKKMGKTEAEVSVWLSGQHNFTLKTLAKISVVLEEDLIKVC